ncbi:GIY-YIG nuclease family protein [Paraburkholderia fungorum]|uniref:GIY-YIG nuclease family protein n=1 Tax=Paraburkholderia fungorum TaxID=134537 RepID=UPI0038BC3E94
MFKTADGETLELAPWRMRRAMRLVAEVRRYPPGTPPQALIRDLRQIFARARRVSTQPRIGTARLQSSGACCQACLLARQQQGVLTLLGISLSPQSRSPHLYESGAPQFEFESMPRSATVDLKWTDWLPLERAPDKVKGAGVYILRRAGSAIYVGMSANLPQRLRLHLWCANNHGNTGLSVAVANVDAGALRAIEHTLVRALRDHVMNRQLKVAMKIGPGPLKVTHLLPSGLSSPYVTGNRVQRPAGGQFEWST